MERNLIQNIDQLVKIKQSFEDDISRNIYNDLVLFRLTGKNAYIHDIVCNYNRKEDAHYKGICELIEENRYSQKDNIILFGAAAFAYDVYRYLQEFNIRITGICDNDIKKQQAGFGEYTVFSPREMVPQNLDAVYLVTAIDHFIKMDIKKELIEYGVPEDRIVFALTYYGKQYFDENIVKPEKDEVFIDCGSLDCVTCYKFREWVGGKYNKIYSFEPDPDNLEKCYKNIENFQLKNIEMLPYGVWDKKDELHFNCAKGGSSISDYGETVIKTISIDEILNGDKATFIKMDIEGAELKALIGAKETIRKWHPKLAISIYHKPEDLIELPVYIKELNPEYKFYLRHYSSSLFESVLYAI